MGKGSTLILALIVFVSFSLIASAFGGEGGAGIDFEITTDFFSKYVWRGQLLDVDPVFQTGLNASFKGLNAAIWGSLELTNINDNGGEFTEFDYSLDYSGDFPGINGLGYSVGVIYYDFPNTDFSGTTEVYWGFSLDVPFSPSVTVYHDVDEVEGSYVSLTFGHSIEKILDITPNLPVGMDISASLGWGSSSYNKSYWGVDSSKMQDLTLSVSFPLGPGGWTITPSLNYVTLLSGSIRDNAADSDIFFAGVGLSKSF